MVVNLVKSDIEKVKKRNLIFIAILIPLAFSGLIFLDFLIRYNSYLYPMAQQNGVSSWDVLYKEIRIVSFMQYLPMFGALVTVGLFNEEYKNNGWTLVLTYPISRAKVFVSKYITAMLIMLVFIIINNLSLMIVGFLMKFPEPLNITFFIKVSIFEFIGLSTVVIIHTWISSFKKFNVISMAIAFGGSLLGKMLFWGENRSICKFIPYCFPSFADLSTLNNSNFILIEASILTIVLFILFTYEFSKRKNY